MAKVLQQSDGVISFDILIDGTKIKDTVEINEISVEMEVNRITSATILMEDGGALGVDNASFANSESSDFVPGNEIEISLGYDNKRKTVFKGIIVSQGLTVKSGKSQLTINCKDKAISMTKGRFNAIFTDKKDSDAINSIAGKYGLKVEVDDTTQVIPSLVQSNCNDWDFVLIRAELNNMSALTDQNTLTIKKNDFSIAPKFEINSSQFVIDVELKLDSEDIASKYELTAWDIKNQKEINESINITDGLSQGNITANKLSSVLKNTSSDHYSSASLSKDELKYWGTSLANKAMLTKIRGRITVPGTADIKAGDIVLLSGFSARFNGNIYISKIDQTVQDGNWITTLYVGRSLQWHSALLDVEETFASGIIPPINGAQIAKVKQIIKDPDENYRVLVTLPVFSGIGEDEGVWARLTFPYATADAGFFFFPEIDDEVLVTFINNDPRYPVITGAVYSSKNKPKETPDEKNQFKSIYSKSGIKIRFDDEDKILVIDTPGGNSFALDDKNKKIEVKDLNDNSWVLNESGIEIQSPKDIKLSADGDVNISAKGGINLKATSDAKVDGMNIQLSAQTGFTAKGNASAELSASGQTTVKGAMVMIN